MRRERGFEGRFAAIALSIAAALGLSAGCGEDEPRGSSGGGEGGDNGSTTSASATSGSRTGAGGAMATSSSGTGAGGAGGEGGAGGAGGEGGSGGSGGAGGEGGAGGSGGSGGSAQALPACYEGCSTPNDCVLNAPLYTTENWECNAGTCKWLGCMSTAECQDTFMSPDYICKAVPGGSYSTCYETCSAPADCAAASPLLDADNYACSAGVCEWLGCNSTAECTQAYMNNQYLCAVIAGSTVKSCLLSCSAPSDCVLSNNALQDADNYACVSGVCQYTGCNSNAECEAAYMMAGYVCK